MRIRSNQSLRALSDRLQKQINLRQPALQKRLQRKAFERGVPSWVALFVLARQHRVPYLRELNLLPADKQAVVKDAIAKIGDGVGSSRLGKTVEEAVAPAGRESHSTLTILINSMVGDEELRKRCGDLLRARSAYDRVLREATVVLEQRIRTKAGIKEKLKPGELVVRAINPEPAKAILKLSEDKSEQQGFFEVYHGTVLAFRNIAHHQLLESTSQLDALRFCSFVDLLLSILEKTTDSPPV